MEDEKMKKWWTEEPNLGHWQSWVAIRGPHYTMEK
jgi:hypothetical protein